MQHEFTFQIPLDECKKRMKFITNDFDYDLNFGQVLLGSISRGSFYLKIELKGNDKETTVVLNPIVQNTLDSSNTDYVYNKTLEFVKNKLKPIFTASEEWLKSIEKDRINSDETNKLIIAILCIGGFGMFGLHNFYRGKTFRGILSILFGWTTIPSIIGIIWGIKTLLKR